MTKVKDLLREGLGGDPITRPNRSGMYAGWSWVKWNYGRWRRKWLFVQRKAKLKDSGCFHTVYVSSGNSQDGV